MQYENGARQSGGWAILCHAGRFGVSSVQAEAWHESAKTEIQSLPTNQLWQ
jgi:hypothetical protein